MYPVKESQSDKELQAIIDLRYKVLRRPWNQPADTASDGLEAESVNAFIEDGAGNMLACGRLQENANKVGQIRYMAVADSVRGKGLGKRILSFLEQKARQKGLVKIELQARENSLSFYQGNGYTVRETSFLLWGIIQHYLMEKELQHEARATEE